MKTFVVFKRQTGEIVNAYSLVDKETLATIPPEIIHAKKEVPDGIYSAKEMEAFRDKLL